MSHSIENQTRVSNAILEILINRCNEPIIIIGQGGTGKSHLINEMKETFKRYNYSISYEGDSTYQNNKVYSLLPCFTSNVPANAKTFYL